MMDENKVYSDEELLELAKNGESDAYIMLGLRIYHDSTEASRKAIEYYKKAADMGNVEAMACVAIHLQYCNTAENIAVCNKYAKMGYDRGNKESSIVYLLHMARGIGMEPDPHTAKKELKRLAKGGDAEILTELGRLYLDETVAKPDVKKGIKLLTEAAEQNYESAEYELGRLYLDGRLVEQDLKKSMYYLDRAQAHGLASLVDEDIAEVFSQSGDIDSQIKTLEHGMNNGNEEACLELIEIYKKGISGKSYKKKAFEVALAGAKMGYPYAMCMVGDMYEEGKGTEVNLTEALRWYRMAAA